MGCGSSKPANLAAALAKNLDEKGPVPELDSYCRPIWTQSIDYIYDTAKQNGGTSNLRRNFGQFLRQPRSFWESNIQNVQKLAQQRLSKMKQCLLETTSASASQQRCLWR